MANLNVSRNQFDFVKKAAEKAGKPLKYQTYEKMRQAVAGMSAEELQRALGRTPSTSASDVNVQSTAPASEFSSYQEMLQSPEFASLYDRLEAAERKKIGETETRIDPSGEITEFADPHLTGEVTRTHYGMMPPTRGTPPPNSGYDEDLEAAAASTAAGLGMGPAESAPGETPAPAPTEAPDDESTPAPVPATPGAGNAHAWRGLEDIGGAVGYAIGGSGGPIGSSIGMAVGSLLGRAMSGGKIAPGDVAKTAFGLAGGAIAGTGGRLIGNALGGLLGDGQGGSGGASEAPEGVMSGGGATTVGGGNTEGGMNEMIRLLHEISTNIKTVVNDGMPVQDKRRGGGNVI